MDPRPPFPPFPFPPHLAAGMPFPPPPFMGMRPPFPLPPPPMQQRSRPAVEVGMPSTTVYVQNLNDRVNCRRCMAPSLRALFAPFGHVRRITCRGSLSMRGQAWIEYASAEAAAKAVAAMQGFRLFTKSMQCRFARHMSFKEARKQGKLPEAKQVQTSLKAAKASRPPRLSRRQLMAQMMANPGMMSMMAAAQSAPGQAAAMLDVGLPNKTLFLQSIPSGMSPSHLGDLFRRFPGFDEVRPVPSRADVAFVEFATDMQAAVARQQTDNQGGMRVTFARR